MYPFFEMSWTQIIHHEWEPQALPKANSAKSITDMEIIQTTFRSASGQVKNGQTFTELLAEKYAPFLPVRYLYTIVR